MFSNNMPIWARVKIGGGAGCGHAWVSDGWEWVGIGGGDGTCVGGGGGGGKIGDPVVLI